MSELWKDIVANYLRTTVSPVAAYVFGSVASGRSRSDSDIDLAVFADPPLPGERVLGISGDLAAAIGRPVDVIDFATAPPTLQAEILRNGVPLFVDDEGRRATLAMDAMSRYQRLNEERQPILDARLGKDGWKRLF